MMIAELTEVIGEKHARVRVLERVGNWHGTTKGSVVLGGRAVTAERPRGGTTGEQRSSSADLLDSLVVERVLAGVATRRHIDVAEPVEKRSRNARSPRPSRPSPGGSWSSRLTAPRCLSGCGWATPGTRLS
jgi:hypothetical protein